MKSVYITGTGLFTPEQSISNAELVTAFNSWAENWNQQQAAAIKAGEGNTWKYPLSIPLFK